VCVRRWASANAWCLYVYDEGAASSSAGTMGSTAFDYLHRGPMSPSTERTPLLWSHAALPSTSPPPSRYTIPYVFLLLVFLLCNLLPFYPTGWIPKALLPEDLGTIRLYMLIVADFLMDMSWPSLGLVLEYAAATAIDRQREPRARRMTRKSESLNAFLKAGFKVLPVFSTIGLAVEQLGLEFILFASVYFVMTIGVTFVLVASARGLQARKAQRDDTL